MLLLSYLLDLVMVVVSLVRLIFQVLDFRNIVNTPSIIIFIIIPVIIISKLLNVLFPFIVVVVYELTAQLHIVIVYYEAEVVVVVSVCCSLLLVYETSGIHDEGALDWYLLPAFVMLRDHVWH